MKPRTIAFVFFVLFYFTCLSFEKIGTPTNKEVFSSFLVEFLDTLSKSSINYNFQIRIAQHPISDYIENSIVGTLSPMGYRFFSTHCDTCTIMQISVNKYDVSYKRVKRERPTNFVTRKIELELICLLKPNNSTIEAINFKKSYADTIKIEDLDIVEKDGYPFTGTRPKEPENFLKKYFEPIIVIGSSALAVILFFTVRTK